MICMVIMTDGRADCIAQAIDSADRMLAGPITRRVIHDDSGNSGYRAWLRDAYPEWELVATATRSGFAGAYAHAWRWIADSVAEPLIFGTEDDFTFDRPVDLKDMATVLRAHDWLQQIALRRQPWNDSEKEAGGVVEQRHHCYEEVCHDGSYLLLHRLFWTTNPSLFRASLCADGWPEGPESEGRFGLELLSDPDFRCAFWGPRDGGTWVTHIGHQRVGHGY